MSVAAVRRSFRVIHHLKERGETRFTDLVRLLSPISRTALSHLLTSLEEIGELEHDGRVYRLACTAAVLSPSLRTIYSLPPALQCHTHKILERLSAASGQATAIYARVGTSTMKLMDAHNTGERPELGFAPIGQELPLMPVHGFARLFLAYASEADARDAYRQWAPYLQSNPNVRAAATEDVFLADLHKIRRHGYAIEYKEESQCSMRMVVPISIPGSLHLQFAVGVASHFVYLLAAKNYLESLRAAAAELAAVLADKVPTAVAEHRPVAASAPVALRSVSVSPFPEILRPWRPNRRRPFAPGQPALATG